MANFASESDVRLALQLNDTVAVPSDLIAASIAAAHDGILPRVDPAVVAAPPGLLVRGAALLAGACVLRSLAAKDAVDQKQLTIGNQQIEPGSRRTALMAMAENTETQAWQTLAPYLVDCDGRIPAAATDSTPVLGEA